jgi:hypothetical protein
MAIVALMGFAGNLISIAVLSRYCKILFYLISKDFLYFMSTLLREKAEEGKKRLTSLMLFHASAGKLCWNF